MKQFGTVKEISAWLKSRKNNEQSIGFVPTMGALHKGHISLINRSKKENKITVCSIFVNPIQFNNEEDLIKYPRTLSQDLKMLDACGCDAVFTPSTSEIYPKNEPAKLNIEFGMLDQALS